MHVEKYQVQRSGKEGYSKILWQLAVGELLRR